MITNKHPVYLIIGFNSSLAHIADQNKCLSLNNESCMVRPTLIYLNPFKLRYYPCKVNLDKCSGSCNSGNDLCLKI